MNFTTQDISDTRKKITVSISGDEIATEDKQLLAQFTQQAKIPGFRPGKAPAKMIRTKYAKELSAELTSKCVQKAYNCIVKDADVEISNVIDLEEKVFVAGEDNEIVVTLDINPKFDLPEYKGLAVEAGSDAVSDEDVDKAIETLRSQSAEFNKVDREVAQGDYVQVTYVGKIGDEEIASLVEDKPVWGSQQKTWEEAGAQGEQRLGVDAVIDGVIGLKVGDKKDVSMTFADDHEVEALQGKEAVYSLEIHEVREKILPELNEEFFKKYNVETLEALKESMSKDLENRKKQEIHVSNRTQIMEQLGDAVETSVPESNVEAKAQQFMAQHMSMGMQQGVPQEEFEKNKEEFYASSRMSAERQVKIELILRRIAKAEDITVEEEDMQRAVMHQAMQSRTQIEEYVKELQKDRQRIMQLQQDVLFDKTLEFLVKEANVSVKEAEETKES